MTENQPPPTPSPPPTAAIHATGITGVVTLSLLLLLNATVWPQDRAPSDVGYLLSPVASYLVSVVAGYLTRWRLRHRHAAAAEPPVQPSGPAPPGP